MILVKTTQSLNHMTVTLPIVFCFCSLLHIISFASLVPKESSSNANLIRFHQNFKVFAISLSPGKSSFNLSIWHTQLPKSWHLHIFSFRFPWTWGSATSSLLNPCTCTPHAASGFILALRFVDRTHLTIVRGPSQMAPPLWMPLFLPLNHLIRVDFLLLFTASIAWTSFYLLLNMLFGHSMLTYRCLFQVMGSSKWLCHIYIYNSTMFGTKDDMTKRYWLKS